MIAPMSAAPEKSDPADGPAGPPVVTVVGGGLAGSEAARVLAAAGLAVRLYEMRPATTTPAHKSGDLGELVCSNSLGSLSPTTGKGLLLGELDQLGSLVLRAARTAAVPAGASLAVDREVFATTVTAAIAAEPLIEVVREEVTELPEGPTLITTGPLTGQALSAAIGAVTGSQHLYFYDAIAPIVTAESLDLDVVYAASRYGKGDPDFLNCPLTEEQYETLIDDLLESDKVPAQDFEQAVYFEGCMPIEVMAERGRQTLSFGPLRPVGLEDPRTGRRPHAVVQLRREDKAGQLYNLVGFQTKLKWPEQKRVLRKIPGLEQAEFVRLGSVHRNTFLNAPTLLAPDLSLRARQDLWFGGLIAGTEGYAESAGLGLMAALAIISRLRGLEFEPPPPTTALGGLMAWLREADPEHFQPMNVNFGLLPPLEQRPSQKGKRARREALAARAEAAMTTWLDASPWAEMLRGGQPATRAG